MFDRWTDPKGGHVFVMLFGCPLPFYETAFRINGIRESRENLLVKVSDLLNALKGVQEGGALAPDVTWEEQRNVCCVTDSPNVMRACRGTC